MTPVVTLLTDFGAGSGYPAQMKGVLLSASRELRIVDLSHEVPQYDVLAGALLLEAGVPWFPRDAVHCAVVDPGVGTARRALCVVDREGRRFVAPDNGLLTPVLDGARAFTLDALPRPSLATFHGRDLFAPAAARLAAGAEPASLGAEIGDPVRLRLPVAARDGDRVRGEVLLADPFGNLLTSLRAHDLPAGAAPRVEVGGRHARWVNTFGDGARGELLAMIGSSGRVELAVREGSAAALGLGRGAEVLAWIAGAR